MNTLVLHNKEDPMFTIERIARGDNDTVMWAVCCDNGMRYITIKRWAATEDTVRDVLTFAYLDHTARSKAVNIGGRIAQHLSRHRDDAAVTTLRESGFEQVLSEAAKAAAEAAEDALAAERAQQIDPVRR